MYILNSYCYDSGAVLFKDGVYFAINEERLSKSSLTGVSQQGHQACLDFAGISLNKVDVVSCA